MVLCEDACCKAAFITGIAIDENRFVGRNFLEMVRKFPDITMVRVADMADRAPVPDIPYIEKEWCALFEVFVEFLN
jgi:hypothetical protein